MDNLVAQFSYIFLHPEQSHRSRARQLGISHNSDKKYEAIIKCYELDLEAIKKLGNSGLAKLIRKPKKAVLAEPAWDEELRKLQSGRSRKDAFEDFEAGSDGVPTISYRTYCDRIKKLLSKTSPTMRLHHPPGYAIMVDYAGYTPLALNQSGEPQKTCLFVATLPNSAMVYACCSWTQSVDDFLWANANALEYFDGTPRVIIPDNLKAAVAARPRGKAPIFTAAFIEFCNHYDLIADPARVKRPKDKASVEAHVKIVQRALKLALAKLPILPLAELNDVVQMVVDQINGRYVRRLVKERRCILFEQFEYRELKPLPLHRFEYFKEHNVRKLAPDYHVTWDKCAYSVPYTLIGQSVRLRAFHDRVEIWHDGRPIVTHPRSHVAGSRQTITEHQPPHHQLYHQHEQDRVSLLDWAKSYGCDAKQVAQYEADRNLKGAIKHTQFASLTRLPKEFGVEAFERACAIAAQQARPSLQIVRNILENAAHTGRMPEARRPKHVTTATENIRGANYYASIGDKHD